MTWAAILSEWLPTIISAIATAFTGGAGFPLLQKWLGRLDVRNLEASNDVEKKSLSDIFDFGPHVVDFIKAQNADQTSDKGAALGVRFLFGLFGDRLKSLGIDEAQALRIVQAMISRHTDKPATPPATPPAA